VGVGGAEAGGVTATTVWTHLEDALRAIEDAGLVLPTPGAFDEQLDRAYDSVAAAWNSIAYTPQGGGQS
jgi:hypothetical protein